MTFKKFAVLTTVIAVVMLMTVLLAMPVHAEEPEANLPAANSNAG